MWLQRKQLPKTQVLKDISVSLAFSVVSSERAIKQEAQIETQEIPFKHNEDLL